MHYHHADQYQYRPITELFDGHVDWVFCGHVHSYQRMELLRFQGQIQSEYGKGKDEGVGYIVVPPAGNSPVSDFYFVDKGRNKKKARYRERLAYPNFNSEIGFVRVNVQGNKIHVEAYAILTEDDAEYRVERIDHYPVRKG